MLVARLALGLLALVVCLAAVVVGIVSAVVLVAALTLLRLVRG